MKLSFSAQSAFSIMRKNRKTTSVCILISVLVIVLVYPICEEEHYGYKLQNGIMVKIKINQTEWLKLEADRLKRKSIGNFRGVYVREAYRVSDNDIRLVYLENQNNTMNLIARTKHSLWKPVEWSCYNHTCMDILFCSMATRFGTLKIENTPEIISELHVTTEMNDEYTVIPVTDVRFRGTYKHKLGVCVNPIFFYTDWTLIIQFFESWIAQGATKFYFYLHSYTWQTKQILDLYKQSLGNDSLELIEWSDVPVADRDRGNYEKDPNSRIFRQAATAFMHDCMLKARSNVKFISNTDLDDLPVSYDLNIPKFLDDLSERYPNAGQFKADWLLSHQPISWNNINKPKDVSFNLYETRIVDLLNVRKDYRASKKLFHRPERVIHFDMHSTYENELSPFKEGQYTTIEIYNNTNFFFLHSRRFERSFLSPLFVEYNDSYNLTSLSMLDKKMHESFSKRMKGTKYAEMKLSPWAIECRQTTRDLEQCRREAFGEILNDENQMCQQSSSGCEGMLSAGIKFIKATQTWINVAHRALFNDYVVHRNDSKPI